MRTLKLHSLIVAILAAEIASGQQKPAAWRGVVRDALGKPVVGAVIELRPAGGGSGRGLPSPGSQTLSATTGPDGAFVFPSLAPGAYSIAIRGQNKAASIELGDGEQLGAGLELAPDRLAVTSAAGKEALVSSGGERLGSKEVSSLPLNKRDFSQLLLLAAGTMADTNGAANFTQQFAVNGQRGMNAVFAMDGIYVTDSELGGATFTDFNVDAIQEIQSSSGVMPAEVGQGAAGFTNVVTKSGNEEVHGAVFEFVRNAAFDARNFFDRRTIANPRRIPPFQRNEFGFTNGGPVVLPGLYNGRKRTYYFGQYQGFRQVLGTTQVLPVPTAAERQGRDTTTIPGDTLMVPVSPLVAPVLAGYPMPNDPQGAFGARTYATSAKISTTSNQFSVRIDHQISEKSRLFARFNFNNVDGPITNPSQVAINPTFGVRFFDHQRHFGLAYTRSVTPAFTSESSFGFLRTTPFFPTTNPTQPGIAFGDGLYEPFNSAAGQFLGSFGNIFQVRQNVSYARGAHTFKMGFEGRFNHDTTIFGFLPNGIYTFGGGTAYSPVDIPSLSGRHDVHAGDALPDALTGFLTATPFQYTAEVGAPNFATGNRTGESAVRREAYNFYFQDDWKATPRLSVNYGLRYEVNSRIHEAKHRSSNMLILGPNGRPVPYWTPGARQKLLFYPQPPYQKDWSGWGPRLELGYRASESTTLHAGGAITTILTNLFQENFITGGIPFVFNPFLAAAPGAPVPFQNAAFQFNFPQILTTAGAPLMPTGRTTDVPANTAMDLLRFERDFAAVTPGHQVQALEIFGTSRDFRNGYIESWTAGVEHDFKDIKFSASYVGTAGVKLVSVIFPNGYAGADPAFAPFTLFDAKGNVQGGVGPELFVSNRSHSSYHALETSVSKTSPRAGLGFQASYTFSKSLDDTSNIFGSLTAPSGTVLQTFSQNPRHPGADKGPSTFDIEHVLVLSLIQQMPFDRVAFLKPLRRGITSGWQFLNITTLTSGSPFSIYSGIQQTGVGSFNADRPDQVGRPVLSTSRAVREDYFGQADANANFFSIPIGVAGGTGPNQGRFGTLGRSTFRGPSYHNFDVAVIKDTTFGRRGTGEAMTLEFRAEFFNVFNRVNFGLPANIVRGSGFGLISRTAGSSRQVQFSLKLIY